MFDHVWQRQVIAQKRLCVHALDTGLRSTCYARDDASPAEDTIDNTLARGQLSPSLALLSPFVPPGSQTTNRGCSCFSVNPFLWMFCR